MNKEIIISENIKVITPFNALFSYLSGENAMNVLIFEKEKHKLVADIPVFLLKGAESEEEYFNEGWKAACDDNSVDSSSRDKYRFELKK